MLTYQYIKGAFWIEQRNHYKSARYSLNFSYHMNFLFCYNGLANLQIGNNVKV